MAAAFRASFWYEVFTVTMLSTRTSPARALVLISFFVVYVGWGSTYLAIRVALETVPPFLVGASRYLIAGSLLYLIARYTGAERPRLVHWRSATIVGALLLLCGNGSVNLAERRVPSGLAALLVATLPISMTLLGWAFGRERRPNAKGILGLILGFTGVALLVEPWSSAEGRLDQVPIGEALLLLFASTSWAAGSLYSREAPTPKSGLLFTGMQMFAGGALMLIAAGVHGEFSGFHIQAISQRSLLGIFYLTVIGSMVSFTAYVWLLRNCPPSQVATYAYVNPAIAVFLGWAFANEPVSAKVILASAVIVISVILIITAPRKQIVQKS